jgi:TRAP-type C4-dicarboxylate transport system permease small subunit
MFIAFLGAAVGVHEHTHLSVSVLRSAVPARIRTVFVVITDLTMAGFGALMLWYGAQLTMFKWGSLIPLIQLPEGLRSLPLTIGGGLILLFSIGHLIRLCLGVDDRSDSIE